MRREGLVSTACACARFSVYFAIKLSVNVQAHVFMHRVNYPYAFRFCRFCRFCRMLMHVRAVDTRPSLRIIEGLGMRLIYSTIIIILLWSVGILCSVR